MKIIFQSALRCGVLAAVVLAAGAATGARGQETSQTFPYGMDFDVERAEAIAVHRRYPMVAPSFDRFAKAMIFPERAPRETWENLLVEAKMQRANVGADAPGVHFGLSEMIVAAHMYLGDLDSADAEISHWHAMRIRNGWTRARFVWGHEVHLHQWVSMRAIPNIKERLLARTKNWRGLGLSPDEEHTPESLAAIEFVLFYLGGSESRKFLFDDVRPRILMAFPVGHPMRALCEARWSFTLRKLGRLREARAVIEAALAELTPNRPHTNRRLERPLFSEAAVVMMGSGDFQRALELSRGIPEELDAVALPLPEARGYAWGHRATILTALGDHEGAFEAWERSAITDSLNAKMRLGVLRLQLGQTEEGKRLIESAVSLEEVWGGWGWVGASAMTEHYISIGDAANATKWLTGAKDGVSKLSPESVPETAYFEMLAARIAKLNSLPEARRAHLSEALALASNGRSPLNLIKVLFDWADYFHDHGSATTAASVAKLATARLQSFRLSAAGDQLGESASVGPLSLDFQPQMRTAVDRLIGLGRLPEAEQVLAVMHQERYYDFVRSPTRYSARANLVLSEAELSASAVLAAIEPLSVRASERIEAVWSNSEPAEHVDANGQTLQQQRDELRERTKLATVELARALQPSAMHTPAVRVVSAANNATASATTTTIPANTAQVSFLQSDAGFVAQVRTRARSHTVRLSVEAAKINRAVHRFRQQLARPDFDPTHEARALHRLVFKDIDQLLKRERITRVSLSLDGVLRYVPFAALHDGRGYLVNRYAFLHRLPGDAYREVNANAVPVRAADAPMRAAVFAASQFGSSAVGGERMDAAALPHALEELGAVVAALSMGHPKGKLARGARTIESFPAFTVANLRDSITAKTGASVVHIASHFLFEPSAAGQSRLMASDGTVSLREMAQWDWRGVDLVTFSACNSGLSVAKHDAAGQQEIGGPHEMAIRAGARAVISSYWMVNDKSASLFMPPIYRVGLTETTREAPGHGPADWEARLWATQKYFASGRAGAEFQHPHHWAAYALYRAGDPV